ncbi:AAA family ATPase [Methanospirillum stamsii]|uniref:AAA family ATPase n=1 Tax=Methanospirillum stamsii TaxID=1277351 RepID=A0A2V2N4V8_9EURY|nr:ATP-binding protein [Methanospirillum stamsii]PWR74859.1 AAA family ATPase [Methanospirillum stamsii]
MERRVPYGIMNYAELVMENGYFIDKTPFIARLERVKNPVFLRPRRFGKSLLCSMLAYYYDLKKAYRFDELFGHTWIGKNPTQNHNQYIVLKFDFSVIAVSDDLNDTEYAFNRHCTGRILESWYSYPDYMQSAPGFAPDEKASTALSLWLGYLQKTGAPQVYVIIDEYDNFVNQYITSHQDHLYEEITSGDSFLRTFFKVLKEGRQTGAVANVFITGVLPIAIDDLTSSYNIASFLTLDPSFEHMLGFTQAEVSELVDTIYQDFYIDQVTRGEVNDLIKNQYDGYHFVNPDSEAVYNPTMLMFFLRQLSENKTIPADLFDLNMRTDLTWIRRLTGGNEENTRELVFQLTTDESIPFNRKALVSQFNMHEFFEPAFYPVSLFYLGLLTRKDEFDLKVPNLSMKEIAVEYFNEVFHIDPGQERYKEMMQGFIRKPDLSRLFSDYWRLYVSQLPEAIFSQVNENFYRTTFFELCSRYLSTWFVWNVKRSYPKGRTDLEFVGKFNEKFAGLRWIIEFKYFSNTEWAGMKTSLEEFTVREEDTLQIRGYAEGLRHEYPEADIRLFVIYCIVNQGFSVFEVTG